MDVRKRPCAQGTGRPEATPMNELPQSFGLQRAGLVAAKRHSVPEVNSHLNSRHIGNRLRRACPVVRHEDQRDDNHATTSSGGRENHPSPASLVCRPQLKQPPHTNGTVRCMSNSWVRKCNLVRMSGKTLKEGFIGAGTDGFRLPCEYTFLMVSCEPPLNAIFGTRKPARSQRH